MLNTLTISRKISASFTLIVTAVLLTMAVIWMAMSRVEGTTAAASSGNAVYIAALDMETAILRQNSQVRGFLITGDENYLKQYREARADGNRDAAALAALLADDPVARAKVAESLDKITRWRQLWGDPLIARSRRDRMGAQAELTASSAKVTMLPVLAPLRAVRASEKVKLDAALARQNRAIETGRIAMAIGAVLLVAIAIAFSILLGRLLARPIERLTGVMGQLAQGNATISVPDTDRADEIGHMSRAVMVFRDAAMTKAVADDEQRLVVDRVGAALKELAGGDLTVEITDFPASYARLEQDFNAAIAELRSAFAAISAGATGIADGANDIRQASDDLSERTEQQAASLEETAAAMDEITSSVRNTADRANSANLAVRSARDEAEQSGHVVNRAVEAMGGIERASTEISDIISVIDGIAFQTNLLALNAGVEAARAGDAGKGFAVVASEVRALAQRSAEAAKDVKTRIGASSTQVEAGVRLVDETGAALNRIVQRIGEIDGLVSEIAGSTVQQSNGLQQINTAVSEMDGVTQQNAAMVEEATAAARSLASEVDHMTQQVARFRTGAVSPAPAQPVHQLQARAASAGRRIAATRSRSSRVAASASVQDDWSAF